MKQNNRALPIMLLFLVLGVLTRMQVAVTEQNNTNNMEGKGRISFEFPWSIEAKVEVNLTPELINLASKSGSSAVELAESIQMLDGIYVRTYNRRTVDQQELVNYFRWKLKKEKWEAPLRIKADNETFEISLLFDNDKVYGIFVVVVPKVPEEVIFVNIVGKIAPEHVDGLLRNLSNFGAMNIDVRHKLKAQAVPIGDTKQRALLAVKIDYPPTIDGILDDACWKIAPQADRFLHSRFENPVADDSVVKIVYTSKAIYVGWHLYDSEPDKIVAVRTEDQVSFEGIKEDWVSFSIDPFHLHRFTGRTFFMANPLGTKYVSMPGKRQLNPDSKWLDRWNVASKIVKDGWTVEMEISWQMLDYPATTEPIRMGINFDRLQAYTQTHSWWSNIGFPERYADDGHWLHVLPPPKPLNTQGLRIH